MEYLCHKWTRICSTCRKHFWSFPHVWLIPWIVSILTRRLAIVEQAILTLTQHPSSPQVLSRVRVTRSLGLCMFCRSFFVLFLLAIVLSVLLRYTDSWLPLWYLQTLLWTVTTFCQVQKDQINVHNSGMLCIHWWLSYLSRKTNNLILYSIFDHLTFGRWGIFLFVKKSLEFNRLDYHPFSTVTWCLLQKCYHCVCLSASDTGRIQIIGSIYLFFIVFIRYIYHSWMY